MNNHRNTRSKRGKQKKLSWREWSPQDGDRDYYEQYSGGASQREFELYGNGALDYYDSDEELELQEREQYEEDERRWTEENTRDVTVHGIRLRVRPPSNLSRIGQCDYSYACECNRCSIMLLAHNIISFIDNHS